MNRRVTEGQSKSTDDEDQEESEGEGDASGKDNDPDEDDDNIIPNHNHVIWSKGLLPPVVRFLPSSEPELWRYSRTNAVLRKWHGDY